MARAALATLTRGSEQHEPNGAGCAWDDVYLQAEPGGLGMLHLESDDLLMTMVQRDPGNGGNANKTMENQRPNEEADASGSEACGAIACCGVGMGRRVGINTNDAATLSHLHEDSPHGCQTNVLTSTAPNP